MARRWLALTHKRSRSPATSTRSSLAGIFVQIGQAPNTNWLKGMVELSTGGEIIVDDHGRTSVPGVFAAGDADHHAL